MEIVFRGLCGFARRQRAGLDYAEVSILDGGHHPHHGLLIANAEAVDAARTTWNPQRIFASPAGDVLLTWEIGGLEVTADAGGSSTYWNRADVLDLASAHVGTTPKNPARGLFSVYGGTFTAARSKYAVQPLDHKQGGKALKQNFIFADQIRWDTGGTASVDITAKLRGSIVFKPLISPIVSVCNEAAHAGSGLNHFDCYYDLFDLAPGDVKTTVTIPPNNAGPYITLGYNCIDTSEVP